MPAFAAFTINDGQATPVAHTFNPISSENGVFVWQDQTGGVSLGYPTITYRRQSPGPMRDGLASTADRKTKHFLNIAVPTMETLGTSDAGITPPPQIACIHRMNVEVFQPERGSEAVRKDLTAYGTNLLGHATFKAVLNQQQGFTGA